MPTLDRDPGLFGPSSVTWRVHADPSMLAGGLRSLFLQALHPAAIAGVMEHSSFRADPWGRLLRTAEFVGVTSFGSTAEVHAAAARVRQIHAPLRGRVPVTGAPYRVADPHLLRWVHVAEVSSFVSVAARSGLRLAGEEVDAYLDEQRQVSALLGVDPDAVPGSRAQLTACFEAYLPELEATDLACEAAQFVLRPPIPLTAPLRLPAGLSWAGVAALSFAALPSWARRLYATAGLAPALPLPAPRLLTHLGLGLRAPALPHDLAVTTSLRAVFAPLRLLPPALREGPHLRAARVRLRTP